MAILLSCTSAPPDPLADAASREISELTVALFAAQSDRDLDRTVGFFADDAVLHAGGSPPVVGASAIRAFYERMLGFLESAEAEPLGAQVAASSDLAYGFGALTTSFAGADTVQRFDGRYLIVWKRAAGDWRIAALAITS